MKLTVKEAAARKGVHLQTIHYWIKTGKLPYTIADDGRGTKLIEQSDLDNFQNKRKIKDKSVEVTPNVKLSGRDAEIMELASTMSYQAIGDKFGVSRQRIEQIVKKNRE